MPSWLINFMLSDEFIDLGVIEEDQLFYRLTNSYEKNIEITRDELIDTSIMEIQPLGYSNFK